MKLGHWFDVSSLCMGPFLAINLSNSSFEKRKKNDDLLDLGKTGDWPIQKSAFEDGLAGRVVVLYYKEGRDAAKIYTGTFKSLRKNGETRNGNYRYRLTIEKNWTEEGTTSAPFTQFFQGFTMSSQPTTVWANSGAFDQEKNKVVETEILDPDSDRFESMVGTETMAMIAIRANHQIFVKRLISVWGKRCALTSLAAPRLLQACHIVPYSESNPKEKISAHNGLILCAHLHTLLDSHLLSFDDDGRLMLEESMETRLRALVLDPGNFTLRRTPSSDQIDYLRRHRATAKTLGRNLIRMTLND